MGTALAVHLQETLGWRYVHVYPSILCVCCFFIQSVKKTFYDYLQLKVIMGIAIYFLYRSPKELNVDIPGKG